MQEEEKRKPAIEMTDEEAMEHLFHPKIVDGIRELTRDDESEEDSESLEEEEDRQTEAQRRKDAAKRRLQQRRVEKAQDWPNTSEVEYENEKALLDAHGGNLSIDSA